MLYNVKNKDVLDDLVKIPFLDSFLEYSDLLSDNRYYHMLKAKNCRDFIFKYSSLEKTFLDAGAGRGPYTKIAEDKFKKIYSFEYNLNELEKAKQNIGPNEKVIFQQVDITKIPLEDASVDVAICSEVLEHILENRKAMSEIYRVTKPGGFVLFSMPNNTSLLYAPSRFKNRKVLIDLDKKVNTEKRWEQLRHYTFSYRTIEKIATGAGFKIIQRRGAHVIRIPSKLRKLLMQHSPLLFKLFFHIQIFFEIFFPRYGSFYFLTLKK